jgi:hypothetical protein
MTETLGEVLSVRTLTTADESGYAAFVNDHSQAMLYHSLPYVRMIAAITGATSRTLVAVDADGKMVGVLPLLSRDGQFGAVLNSLPYYGSHGGVLADNPAAASALVDSYNDLATNADVCAATLVENPLAPGATTGVRFTATDSRIGQFTRIAFDERHSEQLMASYHQKTRNMVRKSGKGGMVISEENDALDLVEEVHTENMRALAGRAKEHSFFQLVPVHFTAGSAYRIFVARLDGEPVAALLLFYFRDTVEYYTPVIREAFRDRQPLSLLIHHAMTDASERGYRLWNWGGTWATQDGVYLFKKRWGTFDVPYQYYVQVNNEAVLNASRSTLLEQYPGFFVVPFDLLRAEA